LLPVLHRRFPLNIYFFLAGFATANWAVRIPAVKDQVGASSTELGLALLCLRFGTRRVVIVAGSRPSPR